ncbi:MAG TPA: hypothetical protein VHW24_08980, partial [Bryobacteraceae bacterium]|nr:hypothetical protein [Bryobacteraceae bacterium]
TDYFEMSQVRWINVKRKNAYARVPTHASRFPMHSHQVCPFPALESGHLRRLRRLFFGIHVLLCRQAKLEYVNNNQPELSSGQTVTKGGKCIGRITY